SSQAVTNKRVHASDSACPLSFCNRSRAALQSPLASRSPTSSRHCVALTGRLASLRHAIPSEMAIADMSRAGRVIDWSRARLGMLISGCVGSRTLRAQSLRALRGHGKKCDGAIVLRAVGSLGSVLEDGIIENGGG